MFNGGHIPYANILVPFKLAPDGMKGAQVITLASSLYKAPIKRKYLSLQT
jgi:hypothetical protein